MSKRGADKPLDYDNWDAPDEPTAASVFEQADEETLKKRKMIFVSKKLQSSTQTKRGIFKSLDAFGASQTAPPITSNVSTQKQESNNATFLSKLVILNKEVSEWISKHVNEDPYCVLTPIFKDYEKHLASIKPEDVDSKIKNSDAPSTGDTTVSHPVVSNFSLSQPKSGSSSSLGSNGFNFNFKSTPTATSSDASNSVKPPVFSFGSQPSSSSANSSSLPPVNPPLFSFKPDIPKISTGDTSTGLFSFGTGPSTSGTTISASDQNSEDEEAYVPPKPEVKEVKEEGSVYTVRCRLFYKRADQWTERGLGNLHIIPTGEEKFQLLIRADTNLGNILLNIMVNKDIPMQLQKNNVVFACVPLPPLPGKEKVSNDSPTRPVPMLIRVKTPEAAAALLTEIDKHRGKGSTDVTAPAESSS